jgi:hypothetical protein
MKNTASTQSPNLSGTMETFMKIFTGTFLGVGLVLLFVGLGWAYDYFTDTEISEATDEWVGPLVLTVMGSVFAGIGGGIMYYRAKQKARRELLMRTGRRLQAVITNTYFDTSTSFRSGNEVQHPLIIECEAELSGKKQIFKSEGVWGKKEFINGQQITIYIDTRDYTNYWVDTSEK